MVIGLTQKEEGKIRHRHRNARLKRERLQEGGVKDRYVSVMVIGLIHWKMACLRHRIARLKRERLQEERIPHATLFKQPLMRCQ
jgi:hypothetical protein